MSKRERDFDYDEYEKAIESLRDKDSDEKEPAYYPLEESKPPHY